MAARPGSLQPAVYLSLNRYLKGLFGERVQKIPLDAGLTCPNRDGTKGTGGCIYCDSLGSGTGAAGAGRDVARQMRDGIAWARRRYGAGKFMAYFQSFCNTYALCDELEALYRQALVGPEVVAVAIGTRPDCVDGERLDLIARLCAGRLVWMEYGLQSASDETLARINRRHTAADFVKAVEASRRRGLRICAHIIFGLPGEGIEEMMETVEFLRAIQIDGVKFHQLSVVAGTALHALYARGDYRPMEQEEYARLVAWSISRLPPDTVIHRLAGDPPPGRLIAPDWSKEKRRTIELIEGALADRAHCPAPAPHFSPRICRTRS